MLYDYTEDTLITRDENKIFSKTNYPSSRGFRVIGAVGPGGNGADGVVDNYGYGGGGGGSGEIFSGEEYTDIRDISITIDESF